MSYSADRLQTAAVKLFHRLLLLYSREYSFDYLTDIVLIDDLTQKVFIDHLIYIILIDHLKYIILIDDLMYIILIKIYSFD